MVFTIIMISFVCVQLVTNVENFGFFVSLSVQNQLWIFMLQYITSREKSGWISWASCDLCKFFYLPIHQLWHMKDKHVVFYCLCLRFLVPSVKNNILNLPGKNNILKLPGKNNILKLPGSTYVHEFCNLFNKLLWHIVGWTWNNIEEVQFYHEVLETCHLWL